MLDEQLNYMVQHQYGQFSDNKAEVVAASAGIDQLTDAQH